MTCNQQYENLGVLIFNYQQDTGTRKVMCVAHNEILKLNFHVLQIFPIMVFNLLYFDNWENHIKLYTIQLSLW